MFPALVLEQDGAAPLDADDRAVAELDCAPDAGVELGESRSRARHVVGGARVEDPSGRLSLVLVAQLDEEPALVEVDRSRRRRRCCGDRRGGGRSSVDLCCGHHQHGLLLFFALSQMGLITQPGSALLGPVALLPVVPALVALLGLAA